MKGHEAMKLLTWGLSETEIETVKAQAPDADVEPLTALPAPALEGRLLVGAASEEFVQYR